jgi:Ca2+-binding RTX toxin-like protein
MGQRRTRLVVLLASVIGATVCVSLLGTAAAQVEVGCFGEVATIVRGDGNDSVTGTRGNDVIFTGAGNDRVNGRGGNDRICTSSGNDTVNAGAGNDLVYGALGRDTLLGGSGRDQAIGGPVLMTRWECRGGQWHLVTYDVSAEPPVQVDDINTEQPCVEAPPPAEDRPTRLDGDRILGGSGGDRLLGGGGNDGLVGGAGSDTVFGHAGNDVLGGGTGNDHLSGGPVYMTRWECRNGTWHLVTYDESVTPPREVDDIDTEVPCQPDTPAITPPDNDGVAGGPGRDLLGGGYGNDLLAGQGGRDRLNGGSGEDRLSGGKGRDSCRAGEDRRGCP